jgi:hypothetical protein
MIPQKTNAEALRRIRHCSPDMKKVEKEELESLYIWTHQ